MVPHRLEQHLEIARGVLLSAEGGPRDGTRGIVDAAHQGEPGTTTLEPVVARTVHLEEQARPGHALPSSTMAGRATPTHGRHVGDLQDAPQRALRDGQSLPLDQELREVGPVDAGIAGGGQPHEALAQLIGMAVDGHPPSVPVDQGGGSRPAIVGRQPAHLPLRQLQVGGCLLERHVPRQQVREHGEAMLRLGVQLDRLPRIHGIESDKVAGRLRGDRIAGRPHSRHTGA